MKKIVYIIAAVLGLSFANQAQVQAQVPSTLRTAVSSTSRAAEVTPSEVITITANLNTTLSLTMDKSDVTFDFTTLEDFKSGLGGYENEKYASTGQVSSTSNWKLSYKAQSEMTHKDGDAVMPLDNVGLSAKFTGKNTIQNNAEEAPLALSTKETVILGHDGKVSNAGDGEVNSFSIYWEMGTQNENMNQASIFTQDLKKGSYSTKVEFIATEVL